MIAYGVKLYKIGYWIPDKDLGNDAKTFARGSSINV